MIIHCQYTALMDLDSLKQKMNPKNRNIHSPEQIDKLAEILRYQGVRYPVKVSRRSGLITSGHGRLLACETNHSKFPSEGWDKIPVSEQDYTDEDQEYADTIADNSIASWAELDLSGVNMDIGDLAPDFDISLLGIKDFVVEPADKYDSEIKEKEVDENIETEHECPSCGYKW